MNESKHELEPWYRHGWVWFVIILPLSVVIASIVTINIAFKHRPDVLIDSLIDSKVEPQQVEQHLLKDES